MNVFTRIVADIKFHRLYVCSKCNTKGEGDTEYAELDNSDPFVFQRLLGGIPPNMGKIPVGWSSDSPSGDVFHCPKCNST